MASLDLMAKRKERAQSAFDAATNEAQDTEFRLTIGEDTLAVLGPELPLTVLAPLRQIDSELSLVFSHAMKLATGRGEESGGMSFMLDLLAAYPDLPMKALGIVGEIATNLLGEDGWRKFLDFEPSLQDGMELLAGIVEWYRVDVGEASGSSESQPEDGTTSTTTSDSTSASTPVTPSDEPVIPGSLVSDD